MPRAGDTSCNCNCPKCDGYDECLTCEGEGRLDIDPLSAGANLNAVFTMDDQLNAVVDELCLLGHAAHWSAMA